MRPIDSQRTARRHPHTVGHAHVRRDGGDAFIKDPSGGSAPSRTRDELAETLAEQFVGSATTAQSSNAFDDISFTEEVGGPFVTTRAKLEFGRGVDASNPADAERSPLPQAVSDLIGEPEDEEPEQEL